MIETNMQLTEDEIELLSGKHGKTMQKIMETLTRFGDVCGAKRFVPLDGPSHMVGTYATNATKPYGEMLDKLAAEGIRTKFPFTGNPVPYDAQLMCTEEEEQVFEKLFAEQKRMEANLEKIGMISSDAYTCTCYLPQVNNIPKRGGNYAWAESSAVVFSNSVFGARTNRNGGPIDLFCAIVGKAPQFGLLTDEGRKADWVVEVKTSALPHPHLLGSAIGLKVIEQVPYIKGLTEHLGTQLDLKTQDYLKDMGASTASNGAVGLYHIEFLTPEACEFGTALIRPDAKIYVIDDEELERVKSSYPLMWKNPENAPGLAFIGCPHNSYNQLSDWTMRLEAELTKQNKSKLAVATIFLAATPVLNEFQKSALYPKLSKMGASLSHMCPLLYMLNPHFANKNIITNSNKLRTYTTAKYVDDIKLAQILVEGGICNEKV